MTERGNSPRCPVCSGAPQPLLSLPGQPIYQHPVPPEAEVPAPYAVDLGWVHCADCSHAWQPRFDPQLLALIYRSHYYTPAPGGMALQFRDDFLAALTDFGVPGPGRGLLEIGASDGDVLAELRRRCASDSAVAYEPNRENAAIARGRGLTVREDFFGAAAADEGAPADIVYSRHVIEHVFDFPDFFAGVNGRAAAGADLVLETPSLDFHARQGSLAPFHIEHIHVFSLRSLGTLAARFGWAALNERVTADGNLIVRFRRGSAQDATIRAEEPDLSQLQSRVDAQRGQIRRLTGSHPLVFWGAGSSGVGLVCQLGREPDWWTDGNPNKVGKTFPGLRSRIVSPDQAFAAARARTPAPMLVIASSFGREILPTVRQMGWSGPIIDMHGEQLQ